MATAVVAVSLAACTSGASPSSSPAASATAPPTIGATQPTASEPSTTLPPAPVGSEPAGGTEPPAGGGTGAAFCLVTPEEVAAALQVDAPTPVGNENPGFGGGCFYSAADGALVYSIGVVPASGGDLIAAGLQTQGAVAVPDLGEGAVLVSPQGPLVFKKGDWYVTTGGTPDLPIASDAAAYRAALEALARMADERM
jgi:hypothetical protein